MSSAAVQQHPQSSTIIQSPSSNHRAHQSNDNLDYTHSTPQTASTVRHTRDAAYSNSPMAQPSYDQYHEQQPTALPIRSAAQQSPATIQDGRSSMSGTRPQQYDNGEYTSENERDRRQRAQRTPHDSPAATTSSRTNRSRNTPQQSRSQNAIGQPPMGTDLPRENSAIINHIVIDDPQSDIARERARVAEAQPIAPGTEVTPVTGLGLVGQHGVSDTDRAVASQPRSRQEHLKNPSHRKEVKFGDYILGQTLGEGEFGKVKMGWKKEGGVQVAIKLIRKESLAGNTTRLPKIYREIAILKELEHPNIVRLHEFVETERHMGIILEYASGGELFDYILNHRYLKDPAARRLFAQLVSGVGYLHKKGIVHRDLKLENLLLDRYKNIIITDFGFANTFDPNDELGREVENRIGDKDYTKTEGLDIIQKNGFRRGDLMQTSCGSPCYAAPELVVSDGLYTGRKVDVWSCGVILYAMLAGYLPFDDDPANPEGDNINLLYKYIVSTPLTFPEYVTPHSRDLLRRILVPDPRRRADLFEVAHHSWLSEYGHLVGFIGSSTKSEKDIAKSAMRQGEEPVLGRSASVREPATRSPLVASSQKSPMSPSDDGRSRTSDTKRRTVQLEYVSPNNANAAQAAPIAGPGRTRARADSQGPVEVSPYTSRPQQVTRKEVQSQSMQPPRSQSRGQDAALSGQAAASTSRPNTRGTLPSRGNSYSQPSVAPPTIETAQGRFSQPKTGSPGYMMTTPVPPSPITPQTPLDRPGSHQAFGQFPVKNNQMPQSGGHKRSSTLGSITDRVLGRSSSKRRAQQAQEGSMPPPNEKKNRKYPPVSMQYAVSATPTEDAPRRSTESRRSSFQFLRKNSEAAPNGDTQTKRSSRRFSFLPSNFSMGNLTGRNQSDPDQSDQRASVQRTGRPASKGMPWGRGASRSPSQSTMQSNTQYQDDRTASRRSNVLEKPLPPGMQRKQFRDDGYGGNLLEQDSSERAQEQQRTPGYAQGAQSQSYIQSAQQPQSPQSQGYSQPSQQGQSYSQAPQQGQSYSQAPQQSQSYSQTAQQSQSYSQTAQQSQSRDFTPQQRQDYQSPANRTEPVERFYTPAQDFDQLIANNNRGDSHPQQRYNARMDDGYGNTGEQLDQSTSNAQSIRPQQRRFGDAYEKGHDGSSSGARRVMDFFRRRGKERGAKD